MRLSDGRVYAESLALPASDFIVSQLDGKFWRHHFEGSGREQMEVRMERYFGATFDSGAQTFADSAHSSSLQMNLAQYSGRLECMV